MQFSIATLLSIALGLATASPIISQRAGGPSVITGKAFQVAVQGDLREIDPENAANNAWVLSLDRVSTGFYASVIKPRNRDKTQNPTFYLNGTAGEPQTLNIDIAPLFPMSAVMSSSADIANGENVFAFRNNDSTKGWNIFMRADGTPALGGPAPGSWFVCRRPLVTTTVLMPRYVFADQSPLEGCVSVELVVLCKDLDVLPPGSTWNHDNVGDIKCVAN